MKNILSNLKLMLNPMLMIITILFTLFTSLLFGFWVGIPLGIYSMYQIFFCDEKHKWNGKEWVNETIKKDESDKGIQGE